MSAIPGLSYSGCRLSAEAHDALQRVFNVTVPHLMAQGVRSIRDDEGFPVCQYRGPNHTMCAIGVLIPDVKYQPRLESLSVNASEVLDSLGEQYSPEIFRQTYPNSVLRRLQTIHDDNPPVRWEYLLREYALEHGLIFPSEGVAAAQRSDIWSQRKEALLHRVPPPL